MINNKLQKNNSKKGNDGYTLLFAVLVSALVLAIGISILTIAKKEFLLATSARDSSSAFYAADSGIECASYGELKNNAFDLGSNRTGSLGCNISPTFVSSPYTEPATPGEFKFHVKFGDTGGPCAIVTVKKTIVNGLLVTDIDSRGYNAGWSGNSCSVTSAKRVERAIHLKY